MNDFSDLIILLSAIVLFLLLTIQVNQFFLTNNVKHVQAEVDYYALTMAQQVVDETRSIDTIDNLRNYIDTITRDRVYTLDRESGRSLPFEVTIRKEAMVAGEDLIEKMAASSGQGQGGGPPAGTPHAAPPFSQTVEAYEIHIEVKSSSSDEEMIRMSYSRSFVEG